MTLESKRDSTPPAPPPKHTMIFQKSQLPYEYGGSH